MPAGRGGTGRDVLPHRPAHDGRGAGVRPADGQFLDSCRDRDFALEFLSAASICAMHLSRFAEELVIWSSAQFRFVRLSDRWTTGSSIMPQKKNPDAAELLRAKMGRILGATVALFTVMKGLPLTYSKDMQEDKEQVFDAADTLMLALAAMTGMVGDMTANRDALAAAAGAAFPPRPIWPTGWCATLGLPFREAHHVTGTLVALAEAKGCDLPDLTLARDAGRASRHHRTRSLPCWGWKTRSAAARLMAAPRPIRCAPRSPAGRRAD